MELSPSCPSPRNGQRAVKSGCLKEGKGRGSHTESRTGQRRPEKQLEVLLGYINAGTAAQASCSFTTNCGGRSVTLRETSGEGGGPEPREAVGTQELPSLRQVILSWWTSLSKEVLRPQSFSWCRTGNKQTMRPTHVQGLGERAVTKFFGTRGGGGGGGGENSWYKVFLVFRSKAFTLTLFFFYYSHLVFIIVIYFLYYVYLTIKHLPHITSLLASPFCMSSNKAWICVKSSDSLYSH